VACGHHPARRLKSASGDTSFMVVSRMPPGS
jgi:hypothetical protein